MLKIKCFIVGGMILSSLLYVKAFASANNAAAYVAVANTINAINAANVANANKVRERDNDEKPSTVIFVFAWFAIQTCVVLSAMYVVQLIDFFYGKHDDI